MEVGGGGGSEAGGGGGALCSRLQTHRQANNTADSERACPTFNLYTIDINLVKMTQKLTATPFKGTEELLTA